jgi:hypothetical protein
MKTNQTILTPRTYPCILAKCIHTENYTKGRKVLLSSGIVLKKSGDEWCPVKEVEIDFLLFSGKIN